MRQYELMVILDPALSNEENTALQAEMVEELNALALSDLKADVWGIKDLAYKIRGSQTGFYILYTFSGEGLSFFDLTKSFNLKKSLWRHMFVKIDE